MTYKEPLTTTTQPGLITLAGDLAGTATTPNVVNITGAAGVATVTASTKLNFGTNPSTSGLINLPNNSSIEARNAANTADLVIATLDSGNTLTIGNTTSAVNVTAGSNINISSASNTNANVNITSGSTAAINFLPGGVGKAGITTSGTQIGSATQALGGGVLVVGITNATTIPTSLLVGSGAGNGMVMYSNNGSLEIDGYGIGFNKLSPTPTFYQTAPTTDIVPFDMDITPQPNYASAITNIQGGSLVINLNPSLGNGGTFGQPGGFRIKDQKNSNTTIFEVRSFAFNGVGSAAMYLGNSNATALVAAASGNGLNINTNTELLTNINSSTITAHTSNGLQLGSSVAFGGGAGVFGMKNATTIPTSLLSGTGSGLVLYSNNGQLEIDGYGINFNSLSQTPGIYQTAAASDVVPQNLTLSPQGPFASAATNLTSGSVNINFPLPKSGTTRGLFNLQENGVTYLTMSDRATASGTGYGKIWLGSGQSGANASDNNYALAGTANDTFLNSTGDCLISIGGNQWIRVSGGVAETNRGITLGYPGNADYGSTGDNVICIPVALVNPTNSSATSAVILYTETPTNDFKTRGHLGGLFTLCPSGSTGTINTQVQTVDQKIGTCRTASTASPTTILTYTTTSTTAGFITLTAVSRATGTGTGIAIGNAATSVYTCAFENIGGTVAVSAPVLVTGTNVVVAGSITSPVIAATVATNVITFTVVNTALAQIDSQVTAEIVVC